MSDIAAFIAARLGETETLARAAIQASEGHAHWRLLGGMVVAADHPDWAIMTETLEEIASHIAWNDPGRVLREVEVDRRLIAAYEAATEGSIVWDMLGFAVGIRAAIWADHPDYRQ